MSKAKGCITASHAVGNPGEIKHSAKAAYVSHDDSSQYEAMKNLRDNPCAFSYFFMHKERAVI
ncbi:hypothetical protein [Phyllobacterium leguminum]|uniref:hypothetical protein n=1 Tax=Phyllobacterium leguminum TaxID=314237 RepID=UPI0011B659A3|nr:hypothetical protein [Phyllobacterium leguminum]